MSVTKKILLGTVAAVAIGGVVLAFSGVAPQTMNTAKLELISSAMASGGHFVDSFIALDSRRTRWWGV